MKEKTTVKQFLSMLLAIVMVLSIIPNLSLFTGAAFYEAEGAVCNYSSGTSPETINEIEPNNTTAQAKDIYPYATVYGHISRPDSDYFRFEVVKTELVTITLKYLKQSWMNETIASIRTDNDIGINGFTTFSEEYCISGNYETVANGLNLVYRMSIKLTPGIYYFRIESDEASDPYSFVAEYSLPQEVSGYAYIESSLCENPFGYPSQKLSIEGSFLPSNAVLQYTWLRDGVAIDGATEKDYYVTAADIGKSISAVVTGKGPAFFGSVNCNNSITPQKSIAGIKVKTMPNKLTYELNDTFNIKGLVLSRFYNDGSFDTVYPIQMNDDYTVDVPEFNVEGEKIVTITYHTDYEDFSVSFPITVKCSHPSKTLIEDVPSTCVFEGHRIEHCTVCDKDITTVIGINPNSHNYSDWSIDTAATCTEDGIRSKTCSDCGTTKTETVARLGHSFSSSWTTDTVATCTENGSKSHHCTRCNERKDVTAIDAIGHTYGSWVIDTAATCTEDGLKYKTCSDCGKVITELIQKTEHTYGTWVIYKAATCTEDGVRIKTCSGCGDEISEAIIKLGHNFSKEWTIDKAATTSATGSKSHHCTRCSAKTDVTVIPKLPAVPAAPKLSSVKNASTGVTVTWGKVSSATGYRVYRKASSEKSWTKIATITKNTTVSYTDKSAKSGTTYAYTVRGYNSAGTGAYNKTGLSIRYLAQPKVTAANAAKAVTVKWGKITGATGYIVYRKAGSAKSWTKLATITKNGTTSYTDKNVKSGTNYKYTVKAYYGKTYSSYTSGTAIKFLSPTTLKSAVSGKTGITLKFNKVTAGTGYIIYRKTGNGSYVRLATVSGNTKTTYVDKTAKKGKTYTYTVKVSNGKYYSANSNTKTCKDKY